MSRGQFKRVALAALFLGSALQLGCSKAELGGAPELYQFTAAPDGDTLHVTSAEGKSLKVRIAGIDTPERGQAYWRVARSHLIELAQAEELRLACYKKDQYERSICRVWSGGRDVAASLLEQGLAWHYKQFESEQTPAERELYARLQTEAQKSRLGLWREPDPMNPSECRKARRSGLKCR